MTLWSCFVVDNSSLIFYSFLIILSIMFSQASKLKWQVNGWKKLQTVMEYDQSLELSFYLGERNTKI